MREFAANPPTLLLSDDAARIAVTQMLNTKLDRFSSRIWDLIDQSNPLLFALLNVYLSEIEDSELEAERKIDLTKAYKVGSVTAYFSLSQNETPDLPIVGTYATRYAHAFLSEYGQTSASIGSLLIDPNLNHVISIVKDFYEKPLKLDNINQTSVDIGAGFTRLFLDNQFKWAGSAELN